MFNCCCLVVRIEDNIVAVGLKKTKKCYRCQPNYDFFFTFFVETCSKLMVISSSVYQGCKENWSKRLHLFFDSDRSYVETDDINWPKFKFLVFFFDNSLCAMLLDPSVLKKLLIYSKLIYTYNLFFEDLFSDECTSNLNIHGNLYNSQVINIARINWKVVHFPKILII